MIIQASPQHRGHLGPVYGNSHLEHRLLGVKGPRIHHHNLTGVTHLLVSGVADHVATEAKVSRSHGTLGLDLANLLAGLDVPQPHSVVRGPRDEVRGVPLGVQTPHSATVTVIGAKPLTIKRIPNVRVVILSTTEEQVTLPVVFDLRDGSLVPVHHDRLHDEILQSDGLSCRSESSNIL